MPANHHPALLSPDVVSRDLWRTGTAARHGLLSPETVSGQIENKNFELVPGSLLEVTVNYNQRNSLSIPDTSIMLEGNKAYVYKISEDNVANKTEIIFGLRNKGKVEVISGLVEGDLIVAEGLKKVRPRGKIKPIKN